MTELLRHRGSHRTGFLEDRSRFMGNTRLSVIGFSDQASLPMRTEDGTIWLACNGEITNCRDLERELDLRDLHHFRTASDEETLLSLHVDRVAEKAAGDTWRRSVEPSGSKKAGQLLAPMGG